MYNPDKWVILEIKFKKETFYKLLAGWSGGYVEGQSWRMNSGITKVSTEGDYYLFEGNSGSVYMCHKNGYGTNLITSGVLSNILEDKKTKSTVRLLDNQDFLKLIKNN